MRVFNYWRDFFFQSAKCNDSNRGNAITPARATHIILSRRNVEALLHMLDNRTKQRPALVKSDGLVVEVQEDDEVYRGRTPGVMSWENG